MRTHRPLALALALLLSGLALPGGRAALFSPDGSKASGDACTLVVAVRHAEKDTASGDKDPGLTEAGEARAKALSEALAHAHVGAVLVSPARRARETAAPTAARAGVEPRVIPMDGGPDAHVAALVKAVHAEAGKTVLVVGHTNTIPPLLRALGAQANDMGESEYGELFLLSLCPSGPPRLVRATVGAPAH